MTAAEVISLALTRTIREGQIKASDISLARAKYVNTYLTGTIDETSTFYANYVKPVIAYGVIVDIWDRISVEVTDRGVQQMLAQGATRSQDASDRGLYNHSVKLNELIGLMQTNAPAGITAVGVYDEKIMIAERSAAL
jgi:hypothetical protein